MLGIRRLSISRRLTLMNMLVSSAALLLASIAFFSFDFQSFKQEVVRQFGDRSSDRRRELRLRSRFQRRRFR